LVNSLLERLRRRLRELGRPLREGLSSNGGRHSSRADASDAPQRRTEIEPTSRRQASDRTGVGEEARLPAQQPPPPKSTRLKVAVFSKKRHPGPQRQAGTLWGPTSFLDMGTSAAGDDKGDRSPLVLFDTGPVANVAASTPDAMSWPTRPPPGTAHTFETSADFANQPWWTPEQLQTQANMADSPAPPLGGATPLDGAPALGLNAETSRRMPETLQLDLDFGTSGPAWPHRAPGAETDLPGYVPSQ
jgi:hypothetical protein